MKQTLPMILLNAFVITIIWACVGCSPSNELPNGDESFDSLEIVKLIIEEGGFYEIPIERLQRAGLLKNGSELSNLNLYNRGVSQPYWVTDNSESPRLRFYARPVDSLYSPKNVYWLVKGEEGSNQLLINVLSAINETNFRKPQVAHSRSDGVKPSGAGFYYENLYIEKNQFYNPQVDQIEHWFWISLTAPQTHIVDFHISDLTDGMGRVRIEMWASTESSRTPDHRVVISINAQEISSNTWDGRGAYIVDTDLEDGILQEGNNTLEILAPGLEGIPADIYYLDSIQIEYPRQFIANQDSLKFISDGSVHRLDGFTGAASIFDVTNPVQVELIKTSTGTTFEFQGEPDHQYWVVGPRGYLEPEISSPLILNPNLRKAGIGADYLAIGPADLLDPLIPLLEFRQQKGLEVRSVQIEAVYDQFNNGIAEPEAVRRFLRYAIDNWDPAPRFLLLVGDASYDPKGFITSPDANQLPTFLIPTIYGGQTVSDLGYTQLQSDVWDPEANTETSHDLAAGRLPARNPEQVQLYVEKVLEYEKYGQITTDEKTWNHNILAVADGQDSSFRADAQAFLDLFPGTYQTHLIAPEAGASGVNAQISNQIEAGNAIVAYFGHGGIDMWGKDQLFSVEDLKELNNLNSYPLVLNLTCLTGLFSHPTSESLAETFLWKQDGGAIALLAPTSLTVPNDQSVLLEAFINTYLANSDMTIGEILQIARDQVQTNSKGLRDVVNTFLLFGDPALRVPTPEK